MFTPKHTMQLMLKNSSYEPGTEIDGPGPSIYYSWQPKIVEPLGFINISTIVPLELLLSFSTWLINVLIPV